MTSIGVDPGKKGSIALVIDGDLVEVMDMPVVTSITGSKMVIAADNSVSKENTTHTSLDPAGILAAMTGFVLRSRGDVVATIEDVHEMPGQSGMFNFGMSKAYPEMAAVALGLPVIWAPPATWKKAMGVTFEKATSLTKARELFPRLATSHFRRKMDEGRAEGALIGLYGYRKAIAIPKRKGVVS